MTSTMEPPAWMRISDQKKQPTLAHGGGGRKTKVVYSMTVGGCRVFRHMGISRALAFNQMNPSTLTRSVIASQIQEFHDYRHESVLFFDETRRASRFADLVIYNEEGGLYIQRGKKNEA